MQAFVCLPLIDEHFVPDLIFDGLANLSRLVRLQLGLVVSGLKEFTLRVRRRPLSFDLLRRRSSGNGFIVSSLAPGLLHWLLSFCAPEDILLRCRPSWPGSFGLDAISLVAVASSRRVARERLHEADPARIFVLLSRLERGLLIL